VDGDVQTPTSSRAAPQTQKRNEGANSSTNEKGNSSAGEGGNSSTQGGDAHQYKQWADVVRTEQVWITYATDGQKKVTEEDWNEFRGAFEENMKVREGEKHLGWMRIDRTVINTSGRIAVHCCNTETADWVVEVTPQLLEGKFKAFELKNFPLDYKRRQYFSFIEGPVPSKERLLECLKLHNPELGVEDWIVEEINPGMMGRQEGSWVYLSIPNTSRSALEEIGFRPFFLSRRLTKLMPSSKRVWNSERRNVEKE